MRILAVTNMYPTSERPFEGIYIEQQILGLRKAGLEIEVLFVNRRRDGMRAYLRLASHLEQKLIQCRPDLVHVMYGGVMADLAMRSLRQTPTVVTFHGSDLLGEHLSGRMRELMAAYGVRCSQRAARRASGVVVVSSALKEALPSDVSADKVRVIPCGIDLYRFSPLNQINCRERLGWSLGQFHVLFASNNGDPVKRPWLAGQAVECLGRSGIHAQIHYLQGVPNDEVPIWINASDVLLLTSQHEGSPTVVKEALACNVAVVSTDVGDVRERIAQVSGCHIAQPDPAELANKLSQVYQSGTRVEGRKKVEALSLEAIADQLKRFYGEILTHRGTSNHFNVTGSVC